MGLTPRSAQDHSHPLHTVSHGHIRSTGPGSGQLGPWCKPPAHLGRIRAPASKVRSPFWLDPVQPGQEVWGLGKQSLIRWAVRREGGAR